MQIFMVHCVHQWSDNNLSLYVITKFRPFSSKSFKFCLTILCHKYSHMVWGSVTTWRIFTMLQNLPHEMLWPLLTCKCQRDQYHGTAAFVTAIIYYCWQHTLAYAHCLSSAYNLYCIYTDLLKSQINNTPIRFGLIAPPLVSRCKANLGHSWCILI